MRTLAWLLVGLSALAFVLAAVTVLISQSILGVGAESFSRACTNLALIAIALLLTVKKENA